MPKTEQDGNADVGAISAALFTGDEIGDGAEAIEGGAEIPSLGDGPGASGGLATREPANGAELPHSDANGLPARESARLRREGDARAIAAAVEGTRRRVSSGVLATKELLRLRLLLTVILRAAWHGPSTPRVSPLQVLPLVNGADMVTWPRLAARVLDAFFGTRDPAVLRVAIGLESDRLSDDVLECMACCRWTAEAVLAAVRTHRACIQFAPILSGLADRVQALTPLSPEEVAAPAYAGVVEAMGERFSVRLGVHPASFADRLNACSPPRANSHRKGGSCGPEPLTRIGPVSGTRSLRL